MFTLFTEPVNSNRNADLRRHRGRICPPRPLSQEPVGRVHTKLLPDSNFEVDTTRTQFESWKAIPQFPGEGRWS